LAGSCLAGAFSAAVTGLPSTVNRLPLGEQIDIGQQFWFKISLTLLDLTVTVFQVFPLLIWITHPVGSFFVRVPARGDRDPDEN
jgi:hypothetical protein